MRGHSAALVALLLVAVSCVDGADFFEPRGTAVPSDSGYEFNFQYDVNVFGEQFPRIKKHYAGHKSGRITLGSGVYTTDFEPSNRRPYQMLQPSEVFSAFRILTAQLSQIRLAGDQLKQFSDMVHTNFWNTADFSAIGGHLFTWEEQRDTAETHKSNTFQAAVIYNETSTYAVYNYIAMNFSAGPTGTPVMAGFSQAGGFESTFLPFTGSNVVKLPTVSGVSNRTLGRYIYRIDTWPPRRGGCLTADPDAASDRTLSTTVAQDSVLGGSFAIVSGRCPDPGTGGTCFITMGGQRIAETRTQNCTDCGGVFLACRVPASYREGSATLSLSMNTNANVYSASFTYVSPDKPSLHRITIGDMENWMKLSAQGLRISYNPASLRGDIKLRVIGYSESGLSQINSDNSPMKTLLEVAAASTGQMDLSSLSCPADVPECDTHHVGFLEIVDSSAPSNYLRSAIIPLGWFVHSYYVNKQSPQWYREKCRTISSTDEQSQKVREQLRTLACPPTLQMVKADTSRYLRLSYCPQLPGGCASATPKQQCFISRPQTNADLHGAPASICCFDDAGGHMLFQELLSADSSAEAWSQQGSRSVRSHPDGLPQSAILLPGQVSFMSNWFWDTLKFLYCCRWSNVGDCPFYFMHERPTPKTSAYVAGRASSMVGDPHMTSFSGRPFLFNGYGEYWLLRSDNFQVQGRFLKLRDSISATFLVSLSARIGTGPAFEASVLATGVSPRFRVLRRLPETTEGSTEVPLSTDFPYIEGGVTIRLNQANNLVIQLSSNSKAIGIDLYAVEGFSFMNAFIAVSDAMKGQTRGLLGRWTDDPSGEFVDAECGIAVFNDNATEFHVAFCIKNQLQSVDSSLFNYDGPRADGFRQINVVQLRDYRPVFSTVGIDSHGEEGLACEAGSNKNCVFDIRVTQDVDIAKLTTSYDRMFGSLQAAANSSGSYCDKPGIRGIQIAANAILSEGASFAVSCAAPLLSSKSSETIQCRRQQVDGAMKWEPDPANIGFDCQLDAVDPGTANAVNAGLIAGITVPVAILVIIAVIVIVVLVRRRSGPSAGGGRPPTKPQQQQQQRQSGLQNSRTTIVSGDSDRDAAGGGYDNQGHGNRRVPPPSGAAGGPGGGAASSAAAHAAASSSLPRSYEPDEQQDGPTGQDDLRRSYEQAQMEPMEPDEFNPNQYAKVGKSEVV